MKKFSKLLCFMVAFVTVMVAFCAVSFAATEEVWVNKSPMSTVRNKFCISTVSGKIYVIGGQTQSLTYLNSIEEFDPATNKWVTKTPMSIARSFHKAVTVNDKIYVIGGAINGGNSFTNSVEEYDPITNKWTTKAPMSTERYQHELAVVNGKIYAIGGANTNAVEEYDPTTNTWKTKASMTVARGNHRAVVVDGKIYVIGGTNNQNGALKSVEEYDPAVDKWTTKASMAFTISSSNVVTIGGKIYAISTDSSGKTHYVEEFNPITNTWLTKAPMENVTGYNELTVVNEKVYSIGGYVNTGSCNVAYLFDPLTNKWTQLASLNTERPVDHKVSVINNKIYVIGGANTNTVEEYSTAVSIPASPTNLTATGGNTKVDLSWDAVEGATSYIVKRSLTPGGPYETITTTSAITYTDSNVTNGITYYYVVTALVNNVESNPSNEASATPIAPTDPEPSGNSAILEITMVTGEMKEYDLTAAELQSFLNWYDGRSNGADKAYYMIPKKNNIKPFLSRKDYIAYDKISSFEVREYTAE